MNSSTFIIYLLILQLTFSQKDTLNLHANDLTGEVPDKMCDLQDSGILEYLWADCGGNDAKVRCKCCDHCYTVENERKL